MISKSFQDSVLACMIGVPEFAAVGSQHLTPAEFEGALANNMGKIAIDFYNRYDTTITRTSFAQVVSQMVKKNTINQDETGVYAAEFQRLNQIDTTDWKFILERMVTFIKHQRLRAFINDAVKTHLPNEDFDKIEGAIQAISNIKTDLEKKGYDYWDKGEITERQEARIQEAMMKKVGISTGIQRMDDHLHKGGWTPKELVVFLAPPKRGKCVTRDTMLLTEDGLVEIGDYVDPALPADTFSDKKVVLLGVDGMEPTSHVYNSGMTKTKKVKAANGMTIEGTPHHPMLVMRDGRHEWVQLNELKKGDWLVSKKGQLIFGRSTNLAKAVYAGKMREISSKRSDAMAPVAYPATMTPDLATFLAMFVAEGYLSKRNEIHFTQANTQTIDHYCRLANKLFKREVPVLTQPDRAPVVQLQSATLRAYLEALGVEWVTSKDKQVPLAVRKAPEPCVRAFLNVLLSLEGAVIRSNITTVHYELTMASEKLMRQVQVLLLNYGITCRLHKKMARATNGTKTMRPYWRIKVSGMRNMVLLKERIGLYDQRKHDKLPDEGDDKTARDWIPNSRRLAQGVLNEIKAKAVIRSLFSKSEHYSLNRFANAPVGEVRELTFAFAEKIISRLDEAGIRGESSDQLRYILDGGFCYTQVETIADDEAVTVDFSVPGTHSFFANGLISHNTMALLWFANQGTLAGYNVAHFSCEVSKDVCATRLDAMNSDVPSDQVIHRATKVADAVAAGIPKGHLSLFEYPTKSLTVGEVKRQVRKLQTEKGIKIDMVTVDYLDILKPNRFQDDIIREQASLGEELRAMAVELKLPVLTASQVNRQGSNKSLITGKDIAGSWEKVMVADEIITLSATEDELAASQLRIHFSESRNSGPCTLNIKTAFDRGRFYQDFVDQDY